MDPAVPGAQRHGHVQGGRLGHVLALRPERLRRAGRRRARPPDRAGRVVLVGLARRGLEHRGRAPPMRHRRDLRRQDVQRHDPPASQHDDRRGHLVPGRVGQLAPRRGGRVQLYLPADGGRLARRLVRGHRRADRPPLPVSLCAAQLKRQRHRVQQPPRQRHCDHAVCAHLCRAAVGPDERPRPGPERCAAPDVHGGGVRHARPPGAGPHQRQARRRPRVWCPQPVQATDGGTAGSRGAGRGVQRLG
mmetsp:Transcript_15389/g.45734  ORF Transcript_15389/g.45734 Transcript_15389/m.45734 type:complete len:247 (+) Transcript_15389:1213-1953(+)